MARIQYWFSLIIFYLIAFIKYHSLGTSIITQLHSGRRTQLRQTRAPSTLTTRALTKPATWLALQSSIPQYRNDSRPDFYDIPKKKHERKEKETILHTFLHPSNSLVDGIVRHGGPLDPSSLSLYEGIPNIEVERHSLAFSWYVAQEKGALLLLWYIYFWHEAYYWCIGNWAVLTPLSPGESCSL